MGKRAKRGLEEADFRGIAPTERLKLRRQMAAAAGKKESVSLSLFLEVNDLEVEEELSTMATQARTEGVQKRNEEKADFRSSDLETSERTCRSCNVRDS